jgi:cytochrome c5
MRHFTLIIMVALALLIVVAACTQPAPTATPVPPPTAVPTAASTAVPPTLTPPPAPTAGQLAALGQVVFNRSCNSCHGAGYAPVPSHWIQRFSNAQELYNYARTRMPTSGPGSLEPEEYLQIVAWELVGYQIVSADVVLDVNKLADISLSK